MPEASVAPVAKLPVAQRCASCQKPPVLWKWKLAPDISVVLLPTPTPFLSSFEYWDYWAADNESFSWFPKCLPAIGVYRAYDACQPGVFILPKMLVSLCGAYLAYDACQPEVFILPKMLVSQCGVYLAFHACQPVVFIFTSKLGSLLLLLSQSLSHLSLFPTCFGLFWVLFGPLY